MSENTNGCFKEAVCIEAMRIFDSCSDKDCLEDLEVSLTEADEDVVASAAFIKAKCVEVTNATFAIDSVPFNKGFFTVDITYTFSVQIDAYANASSAPRTVTGTATFNKKVILYGSDGSTKSFSSDDISEPAAVGCGCNASTLPRATVTVVEPIVLDAQLRNENADSEFSGCSNKKVYITIGMFSVVQLSRPVPIMIPAYDYCVPEKQCCYNSDSPCELFEKIKFPTNEFFPRGLDECESDCGCKEKADCSDEL